MVPRAGVEPAHRLAVRDFKSLASTSSATQALESPDETGARRDLRLRDLSGKDRILGAPACKARAERPSGVNQPAAAERLFSRQA
jgi:hypothetical protein